MNWTIEGSGVRGQASVVRGLLVVPLLTGVSWPSPKEQRRPATSTEQLTTDNHLLTFAIANAWSSGYFSHDTKEGIVRVFDPQVTPGMDIWTWGFPPTSARQREFGEVPNLGYVEMWGGTARDYSDEARGTLAPKTQRRWKEWMYAYHRTGGLTFANREVAVNLRYDAQHHRADVGIFTTSSKRGAVLDLRLGNKTLLRRKINLSPDRPFQKRVSVPREHPAADWPELSIAHGDNRRERPGRAPGKMDECARAAGSCGPPGRSDFPVTHPGAALADSLASG